MIVAANHDAIRTPRHDVQEFDHAPLDSLGIRATQRSLELGPAPFLPLCHAPFAPQRAVGMEQEVAGRGVDGHVVMEGEVLAPLEGLEAVDDDLGGGTDLLQLSGVEQQAVAAEAGGLALDGGGSDSFGPGGLAVAHRADLRHEQSGHQIGTLLPVGGGEGLCAEVAAAVEACEPLDTPGGAAAGEVALALVAPGGANLLMEKAVGVGAVGRLPAGGVGGHVPSAAMAAPGTITEPEPNP
ncbi:MAG: hypothetical protein Q7W05_14055 [Deltaproteobacteria bacterium]|nr:hypothetical protein [Deltaproteobacteria bacterium]